MVMVLHFAAPKRTFQEVAHAELYIFLRSWFSEAATALLPSLDLLKAMSVTSSAHKME